MIKAAKSDLFIKYLTEFYNFLILYNKIPNLPNVSIIKPILKDQKKASDDLNNIRPISILNCFAQMKLF